MLGNSVSIWSRRGRRQEFNPGLVSGVLRYGFVESAGDSASYPDLTGNGHVFAQGTADARPTFNATALNGRPGLVFDGTDDVLVCTTSLASDLIGGEDNACSVVLVASITSTALTRAGWGVGNSGTNNPICVVERHTSGAYRLIKQGNAGGSDSVEATGGTVDTNPHVIAVVSTESSIALYVDGGSIISTEANIGEMTVNRVALGALTRVATTLFCVTVIAADAFYNRAITDDERQYLERGYAARYGMTLAT